MEMGSIMNTKMREKYPYLYETHMHTSEASLCGRASGAEMARAYKDYGYTGIIITDHNWGGNTAVGREEPLTWEEWVREYCKGFRNAKAEGDKIGLDVFFGYEAGHDATEFLIYGVDEEWLVTHPEIKDASVEEQYRLIHEAGGMVIHAHPYREEFYIPEIRLFPEFVDGVEGINATHSNTKSKSHNDPKFDTLAVAYAKEHHFPMTAGSDMHWTDLFGGGVACKRKLKSIQDYIRLILDDEDYVLTNGEVWYDKYGNVIEE